MEDNFVSKYFSKRAVEIKGQDSIIEGHYDIDDTVDYEVELAIIIGREAYKIKSENAMDYIFGSVFLMISPQGISNSNTVSGLGERVPMATALWVPL